MSWKSENKSYRLIRYLNSIYECNMESSKIITPEKSKFNVILLYIIIAFTYFNIQITISICKYKRNGNEVFID